MKNAKRFLALFLAMLLALGNLSTAVVAAEGPGTAEMTGSAPDTDAPAPTPEAEDTEQEPAPESVQQPAETQQKPVEQGNGGEPEGAPSMSSEEQDANELGGPAGDPTGDDPSDAPELAPGDGAPSGEGDPDNEYLSTGVETEEDKSDTQGDSQEAEEASQEAEDGASEETQTEEIQTEEPAVKEPTIMEEPSADGQICQVIFVFVVDSNRTQISYEALGGDRVRLNFQVQDKIKSLEAAGYEVKWYTDGGLTAEIDDPTDVVVDSFTTYIYGQAVKAGETNAATPPETTEEPQGDILPGNTRVVTVEFWVGNKRVFSQMVKSGDTLRDPGVPAVAAGETFVGWDVQDLPLGAEVTEKFLNAHPGDVIKVTAVTRGGLAYVQFLDDSGSVFYQKSGTPGTSISYTEAETAFVPKVDTQGVNYWYVEGDPGVHYGLSGSVKLPGEPNGVIKLRPQMETRYWITFDANGGTPVDPIHVGAGKTAKAPQAPARTGYKFAGWYENGKLFDFGQPVNASHTLTARWTANETAKYTVIFWKQKVTDSAETINKTYDFWQSRTAEAKVGATLSYSDGQISSGNGAKAVSVPEEADTAGFYFSGTDADNKTVAPEGSTVVNVYYDRETAKVTFHYGGWATLQGVYPLRKVFVASKSAVSYTGLYGQTFEQTNWPGNKIWTYNGEFGPTVTLLSAFVPSFEAWKRDGHTYTLDIYERDDAKHDYLIYHYLQRPDLTGYEQYTETEAFSDGWTINDEFGGYTVKWWSNDSRSVSDPRYRISVDKNSTPTSSSDHRLWVFHDLKSYSLEVHNVYTLNGAWMTETVGTDSKRYKTPLSDIETPARPGGAPEYYQFLGWYTDPYGVHALAAGATMPANDMAIYAVWGIRQVKVTFDANGGAPQPGTQTLTVGRKAKEPGSAPQREGYLFGGWTKDGELFSFDTVITGDTALKARWVSRAQYVKVEYESEYGGTPKDDLTYCQDGSAIAKVAPEAAGVPEGWVFQGWLLPNGKTVMPGESFFIDGEYVRVPEGATDGAFTLRAKYGDPSVPDTTLTYHANYPDDSDDKKVVVPCANNGSVPLKNADELGFSVTGCTFLGWAASAGAAAALYTVPGSIVVDNKGGSNDLYAVWSHPGLSVTMVADKAVVNTAGQVITYTITVTNTGNAPLTDVQVTDTLKYNYYQSYYGTEDRTVGGLEGGTVKDLAPGESVRLVCTYTVQEGDLTHFHLDPSNNPTLRNTAAAKAVYNGEEVKAADSAAEVRIDKQSQDRLTLTKTVYPTHAKEGDTVIYTITVKAKGSSGSVTVRDPMLSLSKTLRRNTAPGPGWTCSGPEGGWYTWVYTSDPYVIRDEGGYVQDGKVVNTATAKNELGDNVQDNATVVFDSVEPELTVTQTADKTNAQLGDTIVYTITVQNTGKIDLTDVTVSDEMMSADGKIGSLPMGATSAPIAYTYTVQEKDILAGRIVNTASATGRAVKDRIAAASTSVTVPTVGQTPALTVEKTADRTSGVDLGEEITYTIQVTNGGNVTLSGVTVTDPLTGLNRSVGSLAPNASVSVKTAHTVTEADILAGRIENTATVTGAFNGVKVTGSDSETVTTVDPNAPLKVEKTADKTTATLSEKIVYTITVTNNGNLTVSGITVTDPLTGLNKSVGSLAPNASASVKTTHIITEADVLAGRLENTATAAGTASNGQKVEASGSNTVTVVPKSTSVNGIVVTKTVTVNGKPASSAKVGDELEFTITVKNTNQKQGMADRTNGAVFKLSVTDDWQGAGDLKWTTSPALPYERERLDSNGSVEFRATYVVQEADADKTLANRASAISGVHYPMGNRVAKGYDTAVVSIDPLKPGLTVEKKADKTTATLGEKITYTITVTNSGEVDLKNIQVKDEKLNKTWTIDSLAKGTASEAFTASYTVTEDDLGTTIENTATATAPDPTDPEKAVTGSDRETVQIPDYDWAKGTWTWSDDLTSAVYSVPRLGGGKALDLPAAVTVSGKTSPTCTEGGYKTCTATVTVKGMRFSDTRTKQTSAALGHQWSSEVRWTADHTGAKVTFTCGRDASHGGTVSVTATAKVTKKPTCTQPGVRTYTADATAKAKKLGCESGTVFTWPEAVPALGHDWDVEGDTVRLKSGVKGDHITLTITCLNDKTHTRTVYTTAEKIDSKPATCTAKGSETYRMSYEFDGLRHVLEDEETYPLPKLPHTWGEWKTVQASGGGAVYERTCTVCGQKEQSDHKHTYTFPEEAEWTVLNDRVVSAGVTVGCADCDWSETLTYSGDLITSRAVTKATCTTAGRTLWTVKVKLDGQTRSYTKLTAAPAKGHSWQESEKGAKWSEDHSTVTFTFKCAACGETVVRKVTSKVLTETAATCEQSGTTLYGASVEFGGVSATASESVEKPALGHDWDVEGEDIPLQTGVSGDFTTVTVFCRNDASHARTVYVSLEQVKDEPSTCTEGGEIGYRMTYKFGGKSYELGEEEDYELPALGHRWTAEHVCALCGAAEPMEAGVTYEWNLPEEDDTSRVSWTQLAVGAAPYLTLTAVRTGSDGSRLEQEIVVTDVTAKSRAAQCEQAGTTTYEAAAEIGGVSKTYTLTLTDVAPTGHRWGSEPAVTWAEDLSEATFTFRCENDASHTKTVTVKSTLETVTAATCEKAGEMRYRAAAQLEDVTATARKSVERPALGHDWGLSTDDANPPKLERVGKKEELTVTLTCRNDPSHTWTTTDLNEELVEQIRAATCVAEGEELYRITLEVNGKDYVLGEEVRGTPKTEHDWGEWTTVEQSGTGTAVRERICRVCGEAEREEVTVTATPGAVSPDTGDETQLLPWLLMLLVSGGCLVVALRRRARG